MKVDLSEHVNAARRVKDHRTGTAKLIEFHGGGCNEHGVYAEREKVELARVGRSYVVASVAQTPKGIWLNGHDVMLPDQGSGSPVSVWNREGYTTREEAIAAVRCEMADRLTRSIETPHNSMSESARAIARKMLVALALPFPSQPKAQQLTLF